MKYYRLLLTLLIPTFVELTSGQGKYEESFSSIQTKQQWCFPWGFPCFPTYAGPSLFPPIFTTSTTTTKPAQISSSTAISSAMPASPPSFEILSTSGTDPEDDVSNSSISSVTTSQFTSSIIPITQTQSTTSSPSPPQNPQAVVESESEDVLSPNEISEDEPNLNNLEVGSNPEELTSIEQELIYKRYAQYRYHIYPK